ncbi:hypothetical protein ACWF0M_16265 [Kribbella sp. NPDC055110]
MPAALLPALAPRLLLVGATLLRRLTPATRRRLPLLRLTRLPWLTRLTVLTVLTRLARLPRLLSPATLLRRLTVRRLALLRRLTVRRLAVLLRLLRLGLLRRLSPATTLALPRGLLSPTTLLWRLAALSPVLPAWLAPRLPRTPWSLRRRRHMCSF